MIIEQQLLSAESRGALARMRGEEVVSISGPSLSSARFAWDRVDINGPSETTTIMVEMSNSTFTGEDDEYPTIHVTRAAPSPTRGATRANEFFQERGRSVSEVWLVRTTVSATHDGEARFTYTTDDCIALRLDVGWLAVSKTGHIMDALRIERALSREELDLPDPATEWVSDLVDTYECSQEWIQLA